MMDNCCLICQQEAYFSLNKYLLQVFPFIQDLECDPEEQAKLKTPKLNHEKRPTLKSKKLSFAEQATFFEDSDDVEFVDDDPAINDVSAIDDPDVDGDSAMDDPNIDGESASQKQILQSQNGQMENEPVSSIFIVMSLLCLMTSSINGMPK